MILSRKEIDPTRPRSTPKSWKSRASASTRCSEQALAEVLIQWPDLPPIGLIKDAVSRTQLSCCALPYDISPATGTIGVVQGASGGTRAISQCAFKDEGNSFSVKHKPHNFSFNRAKNNRWVKMAVPRAKIEINAESDRYRQLYVHSAPASSNLNSDEPLLGGKLRRRSHFFTQMKSSLPPEAIRIRKEADKILRSVQEDEGEYHAEKADDTNGRQTTRDKLRDRERERIDEVIKEHIIKINKPLPSEEVPVFNDYSDIKSRKAPKPYIPMQMRSDFLTHEKNQEIWKWLHFGEDLSDFDYFLSVCC